jgi:hypothetical protein
MFTPIPNYDLETASFGRGNVHRITVIKHSTAAIDDPWERPPGTNVLIIGGRPAREELRQLLEQEPRRVFEPPLAARTIQNLKAWLDIPPKFTRT